MEQNFVVVGRDGSISLVLSATGEIREIQGEELKQSVLDLLRKRQDAGEQLTRLLTTNGLIDFPGDDATGAVGPVDE